MMRSAVRPALIGAALSGLLLAAAPAGVAQVVSAKKPKAAAPAPRPAVRPGQPAGPGQRLTANDAKINALIQRMTLEEKVKMIHANSAFAAGGVPRLGIPELMTSDGPHGVRPEQGRDWKGVPGADDASTYLPTNNALAATWNPRLGYAYGAVLGAEANARGKDVILGPGINIIRVPVNGRNFEYLSEDPFLISQMVVGYIKGVQDQGISACVKHYAANNQEIHRTDVDVNMSERALREIYLPGFKAAVQQGGVNTLMGSYNKFRGTWATENAYLIRDILKGEWGFKGVVMSDWGSVHDTQKALRNGTDLEMGTDLLMGVQNLPAAGTTPGAAATLSSLYDRFYLAAPALKAPHQDPTLVPLIDDKVRRLLRVMYAPNMMDGPKRQSGSYKTTAHQATALKVAEEGIVLLKNEAGMLPLK